MDAAALEVLLGTWAEHQGDRNRMFVALHEPFRSVGYEIVAYRTYGTAHDVAKLHWEPHFQKKMGTGGGYEHQPSKMRYLCCVVSHKSQFKVNQNQNVHVGEQDHDSDFCSSLDA